MKGENIKIMRKIYKKLTQEQKNRSVVFSSCLSESKTEQPNDNRHEIIKGDLNAVETLNRLLDDKFFNSSHWNFNIIRK